MTAKFKKYLSLFLMVMMVMSLLLVSPLSASAAGKTNNYKDYVKYRGQDLQNTYAKLSKGEEINVLYFGGSVTDGSDINDPNKGRIEIHCWREMVGEWLTDNFKNAKVNNFNVAYGGTGTKFGAYRLKEEVLSKKPDLVFVEFSINDNYDGTSVADSSKYFETIVRQIRTQYPKCDIVTILIADKSTMNVKKLHSHAQAHEDICIAYNIPSIHVGRAMAYHLNYNDSMSNWNKYYYDTVHPITEGYEIYFKPIKEYLSNCLLYGGYSGSAKNHTVPKLVNDRLVDGDMKYIDASDALVEASEKLGGKGFTYKDSASKLANTFLGGLDASGANCKFVVEFTGTELTMIIGSDGGMTTAESFTTTVDGKTSRIAAYSKTKPTILISGLSAGKHTAVITPSFKNGHSSGTLWISGFLSRDETKATAKYNHEHSFKKYVSDKNATCSSDGTKTAKCSVSGCDVTDTITDEGSKLEHKFKTTVVKEATDKEDGAAERFCSVCGKFDKSITIPAGKKAEDVVKPEELTSKKEETSSKTDETVDNSGTDSTVTSSTQTDNINVTIGATAKKAGIPKPLLIAMIVLLSLLTVGIGALVYIIIKRKKGQL